MSGSRRSTTDPPCATGRGAPPHRPPVKGGAVDRPPVSGSAAGQGHPSRDGEFLGRLPRLVFSLFLVPLVEIVRGPSKPGRGPRAAGDGVQGHPLLADGGQGCRPGSPRADDDGLCWTGSPRADDGLCWTGSPLADDGLRGQGRPRMSGQGRPASGQGCHPLRPDAGQPDDCTDARVRRQPFG
jgi:hypothetical protein